MKILITGATGKVGSRLVKRLSERGHTVRALVRDAAKASHLGVELAVGDLLDGASLSAAVRGVDAVVHCAAFFRGASAEQAHSVNDTGTQSLARAALEAKVQRFVFISTGLVYGGGHVGVIDEDAVCNPVAPYPVSKLAAERFLLGLAGLDVRVLRLPFVYGDGDPHIAEIVPFMQHFDPSQRMSIAHHVDVAQAVGLLLEAKESRHRVYNLTDDEAPDLAALFASVGAPRPDGSEAERGKPFSSVFSAARLREDLGFRPVFPRLADAVKAKSA